MTMADYTVGTPSVNIILSRRTGAGHKINPRPAIVPPRESF